MNKYALYFTYLLLFSSLLTGCWDKKEIATLAIVQAVGIDLGEDGQIDLSVQILKPSEINSGDGQTIWVVTSNGKTAFDAARNASLSANRRLFFSHNKIIIISEEVAQKGIVPIFDFFLRDAETRALAYVFIAKGKAVDILKGEHEQEQNPSQAISSLADTSTVASYLPKRYLKDLFLVFGSKGSSPILPGINIQRKKEAGKVTEMLVLDNTAVFKHDQLVGWFNHKESRGALWVLNEIKTGTIVVESPYAKDKYVSLEIIRSTTKLLPEIRDGKLSVTINVHEEGNLGEQMSDINLTTPENFAKLEQMQTAAIEDEIMAAVSKAQAWGVDIFGFSEEFHRKYPQEWRDLEANWDEIFPKIEVNLEVSAHLRRIGLSTTPLNSKSIEE